MYIYEQPNWPHFTWELQIIVDQLALVRHQQGRIIGQMETLGFPHRSEAVLQTLTQDVVTSSQIEGEELDWAQVRSSVARRLGMDIGALTPADRSVEGIVEMMLDATQQFDKPLSPERLFGWHASLFPTGYSVMTKITVGAWRDDQTGPMQVISGPIGSEKVHFQAPPVSRINAEMTAFLTWFNTSEDTDLVLKAAIAHLWFVTIHPFDDGNGRIARAITDMLLARSEQTTNRFYSMSSQIRRERSLYYKTLEQTQAGDLDITIWLQWFLTCLNHAFAGAEINLESVLKKARFWDIHAQEQINERQRLILNRLLDGFEGKLTTTKWATINKCSQDTALRDILDLVERKILSKDEAGGRSTSYSLMG